MKMWRTGALLLVFFLTAATAAPTWIDAKLSVCFTPGGNCRSRIVNAINQAQHSIKMQTYSFTSYRVAKALVRAKRRGVKIELIIDKSQFVCGQRNRLKYLFYHHIPIWDDNKLNIAHNKVLIIDDRLVETGSFNYTVSAQRYNAENVVFIDSPQIAALYTQNWLKRQGQSTFMRSFKCASRGEYSGSRNLDH